MIYINKGLLYLFGIASIFMYCDWNTNIFSILVYAIIMILSIINFRKIFNLIKGKFAYMSLFLGCNILYYSVIKIIFTDIDLDNLKYMIITYILIIVFYATREVFDYKTYMLVMSSTAIFVFMNKLMRIGAFSFSEELYIHKKNGMGAVLAILVLYMLWNYMIEKSKLKFMLLIVGIFNLLATQNRGSILGVLIAICFILAYKVYNHKFRFIFIIELIGLSIILVLLNTGIIKEILSSLDYMTLNEYSSYRLDDIMIGMEFFKKNPIQGINFRDVYINFYSNDIHNLWIRTLFNGGIISFILLVSYVCSIFKGIKINVHKKFYFKILLIFGVVVSMLELYSPLGTGTTFCFYWLSISFCFE